MLEIMNKVSNNMKNKQLTGLVFLDLKKAFDTVSHDILIKKLEHYGICGTVNKLFKLYFQDRKQFLIITGYQSSLDTILCPPRFKPRPNFILCLC